MPKFIQPTSAQPHEHTINTEDELLRQLSQDSLSRLLLTLDLSAPASVYTARLESELQIIEQSDFCNYFLIVADYVAWAKQNDIAVGPGRGSGPCSLVGFALGITNIDPIKYNLPFERFVNPEKGSLPDFDLDFCSERHSEVTNYIQLKYGTDRVAQISSNDATPLPARLIICDRPVAELAPLYTNPESGFPVAKMTVAQTSDAGLVRFNVIDQKALTVIQRVVQQLEKSNETIDIDNIALNNTGAYRLLSAGEPTNIAILDTDHYKNVFISVQPERFEQLTAVIALGYPGLPICISRYKERRQESGSIHYIHPALESITAETYGLVLYQEQIMHIAHDIAGLSFAQGDLLRRALKNADSQNITIYKNMFIDGAERFGLSRSDALRMFEFVADSNQYCFNKSHAVAYAMIVYQTAWLKANYPQEYANAKSAICP